MADKKRIVNIVLPLIMLGDMVLYTSVFPPVLS